MHYFSKQFASILNIAHEKNYPKQAIVACQQHIYSNVNCYENGFTEVGTVHKTNLVPVLYLCRVLLHTQKMKTSSRGCERLLKGYGSPPTQPLRTPSKRNSFTDWR